MAKVKLEKDLYAPHPSGREGTYHLVGRKGASVDESLVAAAEGGKTLEQVAAENAGGLVSTASLRGGDEVAGDPDTAADGAEGYDALKVAELRQIADERGIEHEGLKKAELVEALEDADAQG